jgi:hypothetical protein
MVGKLVDFVVTLGFTDFRFVLVKQDGEKGEAEQDAQASDANQNAVGGEFVDGDGHRFDSYSAFTAEAKACERLGWLKVLANSLGMSAHDCSSVKCPTLRRTRTAASR